ncbi:MAG: hypothetical protein KA314_01890 [Chloroflexi bacterium]|nr:hypothetical protein [Chloroflexota bacterium]MBP8054560.1 hypothetical protein [Chloroflexota bacterium]
MAKHALFSGLVYDEDDQLVRTTYIGEEAVYVIDDNGFFRHIDAETIDRQVVAVFVQQLQENRDLAITEALKFMGHDDLFTKAALDASIDEVNTDQIVTHGIPQQARDMLGMMGFRIIINYHGEILRLDQPAVPEE